MRTELYPTLMGYSSVRPNAEVPPYDLSRIMAAAHRIALRGKSYHSTSREALSYGLSAAWEQARVARSFAMIRAQVKVREVTSRERQDSAQATRRVGASFT